MLTVDSLTLYLIQLLNMCFLRSLMVLYRIMLAAFLVMCLSGSAILTCLEVDEQEKTCSCEQVKSISSLEISTDNHVEVEFSHPEDEFPLVISWGSSLSPNGHSYFIQTSPFATYLGLNSPPPEAV